MAEIESLKQNNVGSRELIDKIMSSHSTLDQKTAFSLAKYTLRKHKKYIKRFTVLPLDVTTLVDWLFADREFGKIMEMRNEAVGLAGCWANVHAAGQDEALLEDVGPASRYLIVDDTGGLVVAAIAERMGISHRTKFGAEDANGAEEGANEPEVQTNSSQSRTQVHHQRRDLAMSAASNTLTLVHANQQPNLGLLRYFNFDSNNPQPSHPLYTHLKTLSWLQLLQPEVDITYQEPAIIADSDLAKMRSNRRSTYFRKRKRWERVKSVVDETRVGGFNGLIVASFTDPTSILRHLVPLLTGGSQVVIYSPNVEPLIELADYYSTARRTTFINTPVEERSTKDFPVDPTLLLVPTVQTARVRKWQVLPGRTHPMMTSRGGAEGFIFVGTRVIPAEGKVEARGRPPRGKKAKLDESRIQGADEGDASEDETQGGLRSPTKKMKMENDDELDIKFKVENNDELDVEEAARNDFGEGAIPESVQSPVKQEEVEELGQHAVKQELDGDMDLDTSV